MQTTSEYVSKAENFADEVTHKTTHVLPTVARLCLVSTFLEDGLRMWIQWDQHRDFVSRKWGGGNFLGNVFVIINLVGQLAGFMMVLLRLKVDIACGILSSILILQTLVYQSPMWEIHLRSLSLIGGLLLVVAEARGDGQNLFAGVPSLDENKPKKYLQLSGRILLVVMFVAMLRFELSVLMILQDVLSSILMALVLIGYRTKLSALLLVLLLIFYNVMHNDWWNETEHEIFDFIMFDFFQTMAVIGGLLMIVILGPGGVSLDERKKNW